VRITNRTGKSMSGLLLGERVILNGDPGHGATRPFASGGCTAAAGTAYCPLPTLRPGATILRQGFAQVPLRFSATAPSNVGSLVETLEFVANGTGPCREQRGPACCSGHTRLVAIHGRADPATCHDRTSLPGYGSRPAS
jgi:hypothetical protein